MRLPGFITVIAINWLLVASCSQRKQLFQPVDSKHSGIVFNNKIVETDSLNPIDVTNIYNGGGVGIGDFNNDGLQDVYLTGNMVSSALYLNKGGLEFTDITSIAGVNGSGRWCKGVSVVDINNDGLLDMYVCASMNKDPQQRRNLLYINKGLNKEGVPTFKDEAAAYGLDDSTHSTMANFFDYDNDGDLDVYIVVNEIIAGVNPSVFKHKITDGSFPSTGRLYRNDVNKSLKHPVFTDVTHAAGVTIEGYGHGATISDINKDGWKDIFVTNDFIATDLLYINNQNGTFTEKATTYFKHTSANGMGQDVIDINNDGLSDIVELDMNPEDNYRKKMMLGASSYQTFQLNDFFRYQYQYVRNSIQINEGPRLNANDSIGDPVFSETGYFSGIAETDWSWCPLVADFDNDGWRDLVVTNGFPRDVTDRDFIAYRQEASPITPQENTLAQIPQVKLHNYAFRNNGNCSFSDVSPEWGLTTRTFSNGAAYADLDNDGDLDMIVNNINDEASVYENSLMNEKPGTRHYLTVQLSGDSLNRDGIGAWIEIYYGNQQQVYEQTPYRGYLSSIQANAHFGLGAISTIDSLVIKWPDGSKETRKNVTADNTVNINKKDAGARFDWSSSALAKHNLFSEVTHSLGIRYSHSQTDYVDFNIQKLLPHKFSEYGPSLAAGDLNGDGLDDVVIGGNSSFGAMALLQQDNGLFLQKPITKPVENINVHYQDMGAILFDADGDLDLDLYLAHGGYESKRNSIAYQDQLLINDGKGNFIIDSSALPENLTSKSCVRAVDYDKDGDLDLFVAGRVDPWQYPKPVSSFIYRNDSKDGQIKFVDASSLVAKELANIGLVCDALFTDFDNDSWPDMVLAGEWMPLTFLKNEKGIFRNITNSTGISDQSGWWNSLTAGDFDNDGDIDFLSGNLGQNSFYKATSQHPASIIAKDFDNNGSYDAIPALFLKASQDDTSRKQFAVPGRDDMVKQIIGMRSKFQNYKSYATTTIDQLFTPEQCNGSLRLNANNFNSSFCRNDGDGKFTLVALPLKAQLSALNGMVTDDFDGDGNLDVVINTNDYGTDVSLGRYDALNGLMLKGDGRGNFIAKSIIESGIYIPGNGKALIKLKGKNNKYLLAATQNRGPLAVFQLKKDCKHIVLQPADVTIDISFKDGKKQKQECYYGTSFLSQSARFLQVSKNVESAVITDGNGQTRTLTF
ncbi:FG-GAP-like repeat-containing protein [Flavihumibacter solisilvae]|uniref:RNA-binding protein n=1 Tax=Flavihumibacter solisilvae TaxID=1349421 RepID=A0A0C1L342_9BACT|nr:FG-GAP-like repeat-containing protein [Flavihumibacter solisilvae]KIC94001.1 RNA-binding protein [Flavihumibacter solisilvae]